MECYNEYIPHSYNGELPLVAMDGFTPDFAELVSQREALVAWRKRVEETSRA